MQARGNAAGALTGSSAPPFTTGPKPPVHICGVFASDFERRAATRTFFRVGLMAGERCAVMIDSANADHALSAIGSAAEIAQWCDQGLLTTLLAPSRDASLDDLSIAEMIDVWGSFIEQARHAPIRIGGEATWWLHLVSAERLLEYDLELQLSLPQHLSALCLYDRRRFRADVLRAAMRMHPNKVHARRTFVANPDYSYLRSLPMSAANEVGAVDEH